MNPLNLDILLNYYTDISPIPIWRQESIPDRCEGILLEEYLRDFSVDEGCANYIVTDECLFLGKLVQKGTGNVILLGPVTEYALTADATYRILRQTKTTKGNIRQMKQYLDDIPLVPLQLFIKHLSFLNYLINENGSLLPQSIPNKTRSVSSVVPVNPDALYHNTAQFETYLIYCVEHGRLELVESALENIQRLGLNMGKVSSSALTALKNTFITTASLICRAAVKGGMDYDRAMSLSDAYIQQVEYIQTPSDHYRLFTKMCEDFTRRTYDIQLGANDSQLVRDVARSINGKLHQKITVEELAAEQAVSSSYLSHYFHQQTGKRLTDYIAEQKINEAIHLMKTTDLPLAQIAYQLAFSSQSYFHAVFKKITGVNPGKYPRKTM